MPDSGFLEVVAKQEEAGRLMSASINDNILSEYKVNRVPPSRSTNEGEGGKGSKICPRSGRGRHDNSPSRAKVWPTPS